MKLESITVENYRQFEKAELTFDEGITILAGANNSGKTSLINLIKNIFVDDKLNYNMSDIPAKNMREWVEWVYPIFQKFFRDRKTEENVEKDLLNVVIPKEETDSTHLMKMTTVKIHVSYNPDMDDIINSIVSILLPWYPQTMADLEKRKNALKCLKTDNPRVFWSTLKKLLPNKTRSTSGNPRPKYLKLEIPEEVKVTNAEAHECYVYLVELAVDTARNKNEKLIELIDQLGYMYEPTLTDYLDCLENGFEFDTDENTFEVWIKLRECMARIEPTEGKVIYKQIDRIRQLTEKMEPTDIRVKHREWYLGNRYLFDKGNYANRWKMLEDKKLSAVKEIFDEYGSEEVERFGSAVKNVHDVANKLGHFLKPKEMSSIIEKCFIGILSKEFTINCLISFVYTQGAEKLLETSLCHMEDEFTLEILSKIPFSLQLLDVINQVLDDDTAYWGKSSYAIRLLRRRDRSVKDKLA